MTPAPLPRSVRPVLALLCLSAVALFVILGDEIREGEVFSLDRAILLALRRPGHTGVPIGPRWLEQSAIDISALGGFTVIWLLAAAILGFLLIIRRRKEAGLLAASFAGSAVLNALLKLFFHRARPDVVTHLAQVTNASFPSGHAMLAGATYLTLAAVLAQTQARFAAKAYLVSVALVLTIAIGLSRLYLGVHWPTDVLAGWCIGAAWALAFALLARRAGPHGEAIQPTKTVSPEHAGT